jgi:hypothetical protein
MHRVTGRTAVASIPDGLTLAGGSSGPPRVLATLASALLATIAVLATATLLVPGTHPLASRPSSHGSVATRLPIALAATASASIGASERRFWPVRSGRALTTTGGGIHGAFTPSGASVSAPGGWLGLSLTAAGRGQREQRVAPVAPVDVAGEVVFRHGSITESYRNGPYGLEQGFTLRRRPASDGAPLVLTLGVKGSLSPTQVGSRVLFRTHSGATPLSYGQLAVLDATGRRLPSHMQIGKGTIQLLIDDQHARYPLRIDPFVQQGGKLTASGEVGPGYFGVSVALSSDGDTALIGGSGDSEAHGAAWVFTRSGETWTQQGEKLTGAGEVGEHVSFGESVALSADGNTALIGGAGDNGGYPGVGAAWVFTRSGETWSQQGPKLTGGGEVRDGFFGWSVALSADGNTALIGGPTDNGTPEPAPEGVGAAWVFTRSGETWTQQGAKLTGRRERNKGDFGESVALSADGDTALIGGGGDQRERGAAWVFTRSGATWTQQGSKLKGGGERGGGDFGWSVALSADGNTALIGGLFDHKYRGAAWVFTRSGSTWSQQGPKLTGAGEVGEGSFGWSVALSADGNTALIGGLDDNSTEPPRVEGVGAAWVFTRVGETWTQQGTKLTGGGEVGRADFGSGVALSGDGSTALIGGPGDNGALERVGAAWVFVQ